MNTSILIRLILVHIPDILLIIFIVADSYYEDSLSNRFFYYVVAGVGIFLVMKAMVVVAAAKYYYINRIKYLGRILEEFKKGRFTVSRDMTGGRDEVAAVFNELIAMVKNVNNLVSTQKDEIDKLRELYNNIVLSMSSYFIVLGEKEEIIFANESFCRKFQFDPAEITGKNVEELFFFVTNRIREGIEKVKSTKESVVLEKTHLLSKNRISIIADIKISSIIVQGARQVILVIDDITYKCKKDYEISLISQISESIQRDVEVDMILHTILTGVTSGTGLGFNRAMLFLLDEKGRALLGKMAVGPDSLEEAIEIWNSFNPRNLDVKNLSESLHDPNRKGKRLLEKVLTFSGDTDARSIFSESIQGLESIHVYDSWRDERIDQAMKEFMDVTEFVVVPLIAGNRAIGLIEADNKFNQVPIGEDQIKLLSIFAVQAALSIESYHNLSTMKKEMEKIKDRQEAIVESEKLAAVGRIASHIAHEIRNPLVTMGGYARRVLQLTKSDRVEKAAEVILKESERLEKILSNVMDFTRPTPYIREFHNINDIVEDTFDLLKNLFQERRIRIILNLNRDIPLVKSDFNQMKQVMLNLLQNAIDATQVDGSLEVRTDVDEENVVIIVRDSGTGVKTEDLESIFEPFFTTKVTGVGLGLAIVQKVINDHNGDIRVRNLEEGGTEFRITLPLPK